MEAIAWLSIAVALGCAVWIGMDEIRHPQPMAVMNLVWPISALYLSVLALWGYFRMGRPKAEMRMHGSHDAGHRSQGDSPEKSPDLGQIAVATSHCGAGCAVADVGCDFAIAAAGITIAGSALWAEYAIDLGAAWLLGIVFQYFAIKPMRDSSAADAIWAAVKADTLSIVAFQVGMYAWMAVVYFVLFPHPHLTAFDPRYWLMMQVAMICGFATSFPMNKWLLRSGIKEAM